MLLIPATLWLIIEIFLLEKVVTPAEDGSTTLEATSVSVLLMFRITLIFSLSLAPKRNPSIAYWGSLSAFFCSKRYNLVELPILIVLETSSGK